MRKYVFRNNMLPFFWCATDHLSREVRACRGEPSTFSFQGLYLVSGTAPEQGPMAAGDNCCRMTVVGTTGLGKLNSNTLCCSSYNVWKDLYSKRRNWESWGVRRLVFALGVFWAAPLSPQHCSALLLLEVCRGAVGEKDVLAALCVEVRWTHHSSWLAESH